MSVIDFRQLLNRVFDIANSALKVNIVAGSAGGSSDATAANQATEIAKLTSIDGKITACNTGAVTVSASALPSGASTAANQSTGNTSLGNIDTNTKPVGSLVINQATCGLTSTNFSSQACAKGVQVKASINNTGNCYIGTATGVTTSTGFELAPGESNFFDVNNMNLLWHISDTASQKLSWVAM